MLRGIRLTKPQIHKYLTGFDKYDVDLPVYLENPLSDSDIKDLRDTINAHKLRGVSSEIVSVGSNEESKVNSRFDPRVMVNLSRMVIEFDFPKLVEEKIDGFIKPMYKEDVRLAHFSYLDYSPKYGNGVFMPSLPPHIDAAETLLTFNYQLDSNIEWDIFVSGKPYSLKNGDALVFSAVNQVHWRPKRLWEPGDFVEILTINYSPVTDWRFTGEDDPIDPSKYPEEHRKYLKSLESYSEFTDSWDTYNRMGLDIGIAQDVHGMLK